MSTLLLLSVVFVAASPSPIAGLSPAGVDAYLQRIQAANPNFDARLNRVLLDTLGTPYFDGPLGEGPTSIYDKDPLVDLTRADCVTEVEQAIALAAARNYGDFFATLQRIRYKGGLIDYEARNHFMVTDWLRNNTFCEPVSATLGVKTATVTRTISRKNFFELVKAPGVGANTPDETVTYEYIPSADVDAAEPALPNNSLIVFVGRKLDWLFILHCGIYIRDESGHGQLIEASSKHKAVVSFDLGDYIREQGDRYLGFAAYRIHDPNQN